MPARTAAAPRRRDTQFPGRAGRRIQAQQNLIWSHRELRVALRRWRAETGRWPRRHEWTPSQCRDTIAKRRWQDGGYPHASTVVYHFDSWSKAIMAAGGRPASRPYRVFDEPRLPLWSAEQILRLMDRWAREHDGELPSYQQWNPAMAIRRGRPDMAKEYYQGFWPDSSIVTRRFGSWSTALAAARDRRSRTDR
jgi:hypothetical protein